MQFVTSQPIRRYTAASTGFATSCTASAARFMRPTRSKTWPPDAGEGRPLPASDRHHGASWLATFSSRSDERAANDRQLGIGADRTHSAGAGGRAVAVVDHPGGAGFAHAPTAPDEFGFPGRLGGRTGRADGDLRRDFQPGRWPREQAAELGVVGAHRGRRGPDRVRRVPLVDTQALGAHSALDAAA